MEIVNNLAALRQKRAIGASQLAAEVGVSRQTIYAIEAGTYVPNTIVSLKLARALETSVEELFQIAPEPEARVIRTADVRILGDPSSLPKGQLLRIVKVNKQLVAVLPDEASWGLQPSDAAFVAPIFSTKGKANARVQLLGDGWENPSRILLAGCDPSASLLANALQRQGFELVVAFENSSSALRLLHEGLVHIAGAHLAEKADSKVDLKAITKMFPRSSAAVFSYAIWNEGLVVAPKNPKHIAGIPDLARKDVEITNREPGAGCRVLFDDLLKRQGIATSRVKGYNRITHGQLPAARLVKSGEVDCCISTQSAASSLGLAFIPLAEKPYLLVIRRADLNLAPVHALIEILGRAAYRREVEAFVGYDMRTAGNRLV
jgi:putative molybdopterin biosynthesis protein